MAEKKGNEQFLLQGGALAAAAVISRIIGLIYRIPLTAVIGDLGNNYYGCAFDIYHILLLISSFGLPMAVSRLVSDYRTKGEPANAYRVLKCAFVFALTVGTLACAFVFFGAGYLTQTVFRTPFSIFALRYLAPTLFVTALLGVLRGFFQGMENMRPSAVSQVLEQLVNAVVSVLAAYFFVARGARIGAVLSNTDDYKAAYGAAGAALGTLVGALFSLLFLLVLYVAYVRVFRKKMRRMRGQKAPYPALFRAMLQTVLPVLAQTALFDITIVIEQGVFKYLMAPGAPASDIALSWGVFSGKFKTLVNLPVAVAAAIGAACIPGITACVAQKDTQAASEKIGLTLRFAMLVAFPFAFGLMLLAPFIMQFLFQDTTQLAQGLLLAGGFTVVLYALCMVTASILQGIGRMRAPLIHCALSLPLHAGCLVLLLKYTKLGIYAVPVAMTVFGVCVAVSNVHALLKSGYWKPDYVKTFLRPALAAAVMAPACRVVVLVLDFLIPSVYVTFPVTVFAGVCVYTVLLLMLRAVTPAELILFPGGRQMLMLAVRLHALPHDTDVQ